MNLKLSLTYTRRHEVVPLEMMHYAEHNMCRALFIVPDFPVRNAHCVTDDKVIYESALFLRCVQ